MNGNNQHEFMEKISHALISEPNIAQQEDTISEP
jgi:hypothetical protein